MGLLHYTKNIFIKSITQVFINELADPSFYHILSYIFFYLLRNTLDSHKKEFYRELNIWNVADLLNQVCRAILGDRNGK